MLFRVFQLRRIELKAKISAFLVFIVLSIACNAFAQSDRATSLVRVHLSRVMTEKALVDKGVDIIHVYPDGRADVAVTDEQLDWLRQLSARIKMLQRASLTARSTLDENLGAYHTYAEMLDDMSQLAAAYPELARLDTLGTSIEGRLIVAMKISDNVDIDEGEPEVLIMGCHHSRELMSVEVPLKLAHYLLENYGASPEVTELVDDRETWIAPMINPDGHVYVEQNHSGNWWTWWRKNRRDNGDGTFGVDLNRNYGYMWGYDDAGSSPNTSSEVYRGAGPFSEPETQAVRDFCASRHFTVALSYHSYGELILFPWGYAPLYTDDHELFLALSDSLRQGNYYSPGNTAMGNIYVTNGDTDDWAYGDTTTKNRFFSITVEVNTYEDGGFAPPDALIGPTFDKVLEMNLTAIRVADDPYRVLGPEPPTMYPVVMLNPPNYEIKWSASKPSDHNRAVSWELVEYKNLAGITDTCEPPDTLWVKEGFSLSSARAYSGSYSFYSGSGNELSNKLSMSAVYPMSLGNTLSCRLWYDIEQDWDYAYLEASLDQGLTWQTVPGDVTTNDNPNGSNRGNGITGSSGWWVSAHFYLDSLRVSSDDVIMLRFAYITDSYVANEGVYIDDISPTPIYDRKSTLASALPDTVFHRWPDDTGTFTYLVKATDADGQQSRMSNAVSHTVDDLTNVETPFARSTLKQNYPNPFNPSTIISFTVGSKDVGKDGRAAVSLRLFDVNGRLVSTIVERDLKAGAYSVSWTGVDRGGNSLASGVYFMRLDVGGNTLTRKMVLLR